MKTTYIVIAMVIGMVISWELGAGVAQVPPPPVLGVPGRVVSPPPEDLSPREGRVSPPLPPGINELPSLENAGRAVGMAERTVRLIKPGKIWIRTGPAGEIVFKVALLYQGRCVSTLEFDPETGSLLPKGFHSFRFKPSVTKQKVGEILPGILENLHVLRGAEYRDRELAWSVPLAVQDVIVACLKVSRDGTHIIPDYPAEQEMQAYGR